MDFLICYFVIAIFLNYNFFNFKLVNVNEELVKVVVELVIYCTATILVITYIEDGDKINLKFKVFESSIIFYFLPIKHALDLKHVLSKRGG